jgi:PAS domain S-box-containing protein
MADHQTRDEAELVLRTLAESFLSSSAVGLRSESFVSQGKSGIAPDYETRYKTLIEHIPAIIFVAPLNLSLGEAFVSPQIETLLGFTQEEWLGDPLRWYQQVHPEDKYRWSLEAAGLFATGQPLMSTYRVFSRDKRLLWFQCDARMVYGDDGQPSFIHGIGFDVTELKEAEASLKKARDELEARVEERTQALALINEQLKQEIAWHQRTELQLSAAKEVAETAARIKSEFLANMSHEIRTPLNGVLGMINLVLATQMTPEQHEYVSVAFNSAHGLLEIINQVLDFSKVESGKTQLHDSDFNLRGSLGILIKQMTYSAEEKRLRLTCDIAPDVPNLLRGDVGRLRQVLMNLIGNALKFTHVGGVKVSVEGPAVSQEGTCTLRFSIADTGIGIPAAKAQSIFDPFTQADGSITRQYGGTGLGLTISKELVQLMGGQIHVVSEPGQGSTFSFTARFGIVQDVGEVPPRLPSVDLGTKPKSAEVKRTTSSSLQILVAEDNRINQKVISKIIENAGHVLTLVTNGKEALDAYAGRDFDVALMDIQMPVMDGLTAAAMIRSLETQQARPRLPIIALTAHALKEDILRCIDAGMDSYLSKPFKTDELLMMIEEVTASRSA